MRFDNINQDNRQHSRLGWWPAIAIVLVGTAGFTAVQMGWLQISSRPAIDALLIAAIAEFLLALWIVAAAPLNLIARAQLLAVLAVVQVAALVSVRLDGFAGDGRMILVWRWTPGRQDSWNMAGSPTNDGAMLVDLNRTTRHDWPAFRGLERSGVSAGVHLSRDWQRHPPRLLWRRTIGAGWSSFAVVGRYCVTQEQRGTRETVACYELYTGRQCWAHDDRTSFQEGTGGDGPRATPTIHKGRVYALGATGILNCLDGATGHLVWQRNILDDAGEDNAPFGMAGSPLVEDNMVIVAPGGNGSALVAYDIRTGRRLWRGGQGRAAYSSPHPAQFSTPPAATSPDPASRRVILNFNADGLYAHDQADGSVLWDYPWVTPPEYNNVCQPVPLPVTDATDFDTVLVSSGYGQGAALLEIVPESTGCVVRTRWRSRQLRSKFASIVVRQGFAYGLDENKLVCLDLATGHRRWRGARCGWGQLILADDLLVVQTEPGDVLLVEATPESYRELARLPALKHRTWNHPALAGRILLVRNDREAACYELPVR